MKKDFKQEHISDFKYWMERQNQAKEYMQSVSSIQKVLIEVETPAFWLDWNNKSVREEFDTRLVRAVELYRREQQKGNEVHIYAHGIGKHISEEEMSFLNENGVDLSTVHGEDVSSLFSENEELNTIETSEIASKYFIKEKFGKMFTVSKSINMYKKYLTYIQNNVYPLNYTSINNEYFDFVNEIFRHLLDSVVIGGEYKEKFISKNYDNYSFFLDKEREAIVLQESRKGVGKILIEVAAQHPLVDGLYPNEEFQKRLDRGIELYKAETLKGNSVEFYVPGSLHMLGGVSDKCSLSDAGRNYLISKGIPAELIRGEDINAHYKGEEGVYNSGDECYVASSYYKDANFEKLYSVCSPCQMYRKILFYLSFGVYPHTDTEPTEESWHNYIGDIFFAIPCVATVDHTWQEQSSKYYIDTRLTRNPNLSEETKTVLSELLKLIEKYGEDFQDALNDYLIATKKSVLNLGTKDVEVIKNQRSFE